MLRHPHCEPALAPTSDALHSRPHAPPRIERVPGTTARPFPHSSPLLVPPTSAALPAGQHTPALDEHATATPLHPRRSATPSPAARDSMQYAHAGLPPSLRWLPGTPDQTRGLSPASPGAAHHPPPLPVADASHPLRTRPLPQRLLSRHTTHR